MRCDLCGRRELLGTQKGFNPCSGFLMRVVWCRCMSAWFSILVFGGCHPAAHLFIVIVAPYLTNHHVRCMVQMSIHRLRSTVIVPTSHALFLPCTMLSMAFQNRYQYIPIQVLPCDHILSVCHSCTLGSSPVSILITGFRAATPRPSSSPSDVNSKTLPCSPIDFCLL
jgi:hypothetical protein